MVKGIIEPDTPSILVGRTQNIQEAEQLSSQYEMQGFSTKIVKKGQTPTIIYEVWAGKKPEGAFVKNQRM